MSFVRLFRLHSSLLPLTRVISSSFLSTKYASFVNCNSGTTGCNQTLKSQLHHGCIFNSTKIPLTCFYLRENKLMPPLMTVQARNVVNFSKRGKKKTVKAVAKRFHRTGSGKLKYWPAGKVHNMLAKSRRRCRQLRKPRYVSKVQLKTLNKMISGW